MIDDIILPGVKKIPVSVSGNWLPLKHRDWQGIAFSIEPIVAVTLLRVGNYVQWCLSESKCGNSNEIRLLLLSYEKTDVDVQVNASIGNGGRRSRTILASPEYKPRIPLLDNFETGKITLLCTIDGEPKVDFLGLFLSRQDTKSYPKGLWHIRKHLISGIQEPLVRPLTYGRTGLFKQE
jgi:hypothetical protein